MDGLRAVIARSRAYSVSAILAKINELMTGACDAKLSNGCTPRRANSNCGVLIRISVCRVSWSRFSALSDTSVKRSIHGEVAWSSYASMPLFSEFVYVFIVAFFVRYICIFFCWCVCLRKSVGLAKLTVLSNGVWIWFLWFIYVHTYLKKLRVFFLYNLSNLICRLF